MSTRTKRPQGRPRRAIPAEPLTIRVDRPDAIRWRKLLAQGTITYSGAELFRLVLDLATRRGDIAKDSAK